MINTHYNNIYNPIFEGRISNFSYKLDEVLASKEKIIPCEDLIDLTRCLQETKKKVAKKHRLLGKGYKGAVYQIDSKYALKVPNFFRQGFKLPYFLTGFSDFLKCYFGDQIATFGDYKILKNIGKHTPVGIPHSMDKDITLSIEREKYYNETFLPKFTQIPQKAFDDVAKDCRLLNEFDDGGAKLKYKFDFVNPNNFVLKGDKILITDEIICTNFENNNLSGLLQSMLNYKEIGNQTSSDEKTLPLFRTLYKKIILAGMKEKLPLGYSQNKHAWTHCTEDLCKANTSADTVIKKLSNFKWQSEKNPNYLKDVKAYLDSIFE